MLNVEVVRRVMLKAQVNLRSSTFSANMSEAKISIGELAERSGVPHSALRFYEQTGLLKSVRTAGGQRRYSRDMLRRVAFIRAAQAVGVRLEDINAALAQLPDSRTPTRADWTRLSKRWRAVLDERIVALEALRDQLDQCIGCGCLSLTACRLYNPADVAAVRGSGPRYLLGDARPKIKKA
jgi:MerR family transcriptional regulator, redox-sensitive transcriptional activator SoxR